MTAPLPPYKIANRHIVLNVDDPEKETMWPWPFDVSGAGRPSAAWRARYTPEALTRADLLELAGIASAYTTLITHPSRDLREKLHVLHRVHGVHDVHDEES